MRLLLRVAPVVAIGLVAAAAVHRHAAPRVALHARFEIAFDVDGTRAPDDVAIHARFTAPSGRTDEVGGFFDGARFRVRYAPREPGLHRYEVRADGGRGFRVVSDGEFEAVRGPHDDPGYARIDPKAPHRLILDDGSPLWLLGENRINVWDPSWNWGGRSIEGYLAAMKESGMTTVRVFLFADCGPDPKRVRAGCLEPAVGRFDPAVARTIDRIVEAAERDGLYVVLTADAIGYTPGDVWRGWEHNPYSAARGGPARTPADLFARRELRDAQEKKLAYIADRWGYSTHLAAVDLLNEPEWDGEIPEADWIPWANDMAKRFRAHDPYGHLVTAGSVGLRWNIGSDERPWYGSRENDLVEWHLYGPETYEVHDLARVMTGKVDETWRYGKPVFCGEFAYGGEDHATYDHTHVGIWSAIFSGAGALAHSAPPFTLDSDEPMTPARARHFAVLAQLLGRLGKDDVEPLGHGPQGDGSSSWWLGNGKVRAVWLLAPRAGYGRPVDGERVEVRDLAPGRWRVEWIDDTTGAPLGAPRELTATGGPTTIVAPRFTRHAAALLTRSS